MSWIWITALYVLGFGLLGWLGGISSAGDAISRWGHDASARRRCAVSTCS